MLTIDYIYTFFRIYKLLIIIFIESIKFNFYNFVYYLYSLPKLNRLELLKKITYKLEKENIVYVKIFQSLCLEKDILNNDEKDFLIKYTDSVPYTIYEIDYELINTLQDECNITLTDIEPINTGIVGMVFNGFDASQNKIVIKLLKNNIQKKFENVFDELLFVSYLLSFIPYIKSLKMTKLLLDNKELLFDQMDFKKEANAIQIFTTKFKNNKEFRFPKVYSEITEKYNKVIVMENIEGLRLKDIEHMDFSIKEEFGYLINKLGAIGILYHSVIHCDLHIGNLFFYINNIGDKNNTIIDVPKYQIGLIDFGLTCFPNKNNQFAYYIFFYDIMVNRDYTKLDIMLKTVIEEKEQYNNFEKNYKEAFLKEVACIIDKNLKHEISNYLLIDLGNIFNKYNLNFSKEFNKIVLSLHTANGVAKHLCKNVKNNQLKVYNDLNKINNLLTL